MKDKRKEFKGTEVKLIAGQFVEVKIYAEGRRRPIVTARPKGSMLSSAVIKANIEGGSHEEATV
jgi:NAD(P)H-flavin reductase